MILTLVSPSLNAQVAALSAELANLKAEHARQMEEVAQGVEERGAGALRAVGAEMRQQVGVQVFVLHRCLLKVGHVSE